jgi:hypothetical protein
MTRGTKARQFRCGASVKKRSDMMFKKVSLKAMVAAGLLAVTSMAIPSAVEAKTQVGIYFGVPFYDGALRSDYLYDRRYGWYAPQYRDRVRGYGYGRAQVSCNQAVRDLRRSGYRNIRVIECAGRTYQFEARRGGRNVVLSYNSRTRNFGRI